ncbi:MAG: endonuclease [Polaribacter sp.]|nr:endonuclease [Polaribacter sp.]
MYNKVTLFIAFIITINTYCQQSYYDDVDLRVTGTSLKEALATKIINSHTQFLFYNQVWGASKVTDINPDNNQEVLLIYGFENGSDSDVTNDRERGIDTNGAGSGNWNREHVYSQSLGTPALSDSGPGSDAHHLRPADAQRNSSRNNRKFTNGSGNSGIQTNGGWYPGDEWKGDVARMMMYMYLRYDERCLPTNIGMGDNSSTPDDMIDLFLEWNVQDPVSDFERQRNTYHENTANENAQGNRNPFIDNPILATRIWGGSKAEDIWGIYTSSDSEAPSTPTNITFSNITTFSVDISWSASTDNVETTSYDVFVDGNLVKNTVNTTTTISGLESNTNYSFTVLAKDIVNNTSAQSQAESISTLQDTEAPTVPQNITVANETTTSFVISWDASTDNTAVTAYEVYIDDTKITSVTETTFTATNLTLDTSYKVQISAADNIGNISALSAPITASTNGNDAASSEIFFSEYVEGSSNNKAIELVNLTATDIDLDDYSIKRQSNGGVNGDDWDETGVLLLTGYTIIANSTFVIVNGGAASSSSSSDSNVALAGDFLISAADHIQQNTSDTNWGAPINFNGNDPVGLFKNDVLIDIIGSYNGGSANFAKDKTLRRKTSVTQPNTNFDLDNEWDIYSKDNVDDIGNHSGLTLSTEIFNSPEFKIHPNPVDDILYIQGNSDFETIFVFIYNYLGKKIKAFETNKKEINLSDLKKGIYLLKINNSYSTKFIKK